MSATETPKVAQAVELVLAGTHSVSAAARQCEVARQSVMRAMRRRGEPPRAHPSGPAHHAWKDGRATVARRTHALAAGDPPASMP